MIYYNYKTCVRDNCERESSTLQTMPNEPDNPGAGAINLPDAGILRAWAQHNVMHPFPSAQTKHDLGSMADMTIAQVSDWFKNYRRRQWIADQLDYLIEDTTDDLPTGGGRVAVVSPSVSVFC